MYSRQSNANGSDVLNRITHSYLQVSHSPQSYRNILYNFELGSASYKRGYFRKLSFWDLKVWNVVILGSWRYGSGPYENKGFEKCLCIPLNLWITNLMRTVKFYINIECLLWSPIFLAMCQNSPVTCDLLWRLAVQWLDMFMHNEVTTCTSHLHWVLYLMGVSKTTWILKCE